MEKQIDLYQAIKRIRIRDDRYHGDLYGFVMLGLEYTCSSLGEYRHVSARELVEGLCAYAKKTYGLMAFTVLNHWGIRSTRDFGMAVFHLIDEGVLFKRDEESVEDFDNLLDLQEALEGCYFS
ncbi:MAG: Minf_1886 family protein [Candidatus Latescibacterota bacterium]